MELVTTMICWLTYRDAKRKGPVGNISILFFSFILRLLLQQFQESLQSQKLVFLPGSEKQRKNKHSEPYFSPLMKMHSLKLPKVHQHAKLYSIQKTVKTLQWPCQQGPVAAVAER